jgi:hypothetical protein
MIPQYPLTPLYLTKNDDDPNGIKLVVTYYISRVMVAHFTGIHVRGRQEHAGDRSMLNSTPSCPYVWL